MQLSEQQVRFFHTFGYLILEQVFAADEMVRFGREADALLAELRPRNRDPGQSQAESPFVEYREALSRLADDDRVHGPTSQLLGDDFLWGGSEGHRTGPDEGTNHWWHCDRRDCVELDLTWIKYMLYFQPMTKEEGALRVLPGSHVPSYCLRLMPLDAQQPSTSDELYGVGAADLPCAAIETRPGDLVVFNQYLFHGVFKKQPDRRYLALKFIERPSTAEQVRACRSHGQGVARLPSEFRDNPRPRIRAMVDRLQAADALADSSRARGTVQAVQ